MPSFHLLNRFENQGLGTGAVAGLCQGSHHSHSIPAPCSYPIPALQEAARAHPSSSACSQSSPCLRASPRGMHPNPSPSWLTEQQPPLPSGAPVTPTLGASAATAPANCSTHGSKPAGHCLPGPPGKHQHCPPQEGCTSSKTWSPSQLRPISSCPLGKNQCIYPQNPAAGPAPSQENPRAQAAGELALPGLYRRMGQAGHCTLGTWSPPGMGRSEPAGEPGSGHGAAPFPATSNPPPAAPLGLAEQQSHFPLLEQEYGAGSRTLVLPAVPSIMHTPPWAAPPAPLTFLVNLVVLISTNAAVTAFR